MINLNFDQFYTEIKEVVNNPKPFAHIRFGDGEGIVMGYPEFTVENKARGRWSKWLSKNSIDMKRFAIEIRKAVTIADIVGTPCKRHQNVNQDWRNVKLFMNKFNLLKEDAKTCCMDCTIELQKRNLYKDLLLCKEKVFYISNRDVETKLRKHFKIKSVEGYHLPLQHRPNKGRSLTTAKHYPECYEGIKVWLNNIDVENNIFLVGAGGLGKIYCMWIKEMGGIALDIGSIFDGWEGLITRSYLKTIRDFILP